MRVLRITGALVRASLQTSMQYRLDFFTEGLTGLLGAAGSVAPLFLVYGHREEVMGWTFWDATLVMALFILMQSLISAFIEPNLGEVVEGVRSGNFDLVLVKPADAQLLVSVRRFAPAEIWSVVAALLLIGWALWQRGGTDPLSVLVAMGLVASGMVAMYGLWLIAIATAFWFVRVDNLRWLLWSIGDAGRWPLTVFRPAIRFVLVAVIPVGLVTTFPALALRGEWSGALLATAVGLAGVFAVGSRLLWKQALRSYTSASS